MGLRWTVACVLGEALGIAAVAATYAAIDREQLFPAAPWILAAGAWEGLCLGAAQAFVLRKMGVEPLRWIGLTVLGAVAGYALSLAGGAGGPESTQPEPPAWLLLVLGAGLGVVMGMMMGAVQWIAARGAIGLRPWVAANAIGWAPAMAIIVFAATSADRAWPLYSIAAAGAGAGGLAGLCVGVATGAVVRQAAARRMTSER